MEKTLLGKRWKTGVPRPARKDKMECSRFMKKLGVVAHAFNPSTTTPGRECEIEVGKDQTVWYSIDLEDDKGLSWPRLLQRQGFGKRRESM